MTWPNRQGIRASAGSGKTYNLANYYLAAFLRGAEPAGLLATTFTRKAAGEILGRVLARLAAACEEPALLAQLSQDCHLDHQLTQQEAQAELRRLCLGLHQISIFTIDSFFGRLLSGFQHELGLPNRFKAVDDESPEMLRLRLEAIGDLLAADGDGAVESILDVLHDGKAQRAIITDLEAKLVKPYEIFLTAPASAWDFDSWPRHEAPPQPLDPASAARAVERLASAAESYGTFAKTILQDLGRFEAAAWSKFLTTGLCKPILAGDLTFSKKPIPDDLVQLYLPLLCHARGVLLSGHLEYTRALHRVLHLLHEQYGGRGREGGLMAFRDVPLLLADFMDGADTAELAHRLDARISGLLLDEFQDTDPLQYRILKPFASRIELAPPEEGVLFCVGDMKQSIYGWRGAVPQIFNRFERDMRSVQWQGLDRSYRSAREVLETVNTVFTSLDLNPSLLCKDYAARAARLWQAEYVAHETARTYRGYVELLEYGGPPSDAAEDEESDNPDYDGWIASEIQRIWLASPERTIGVLLRTNLAARAVAERLKALGVPATSEGGGDLRDDPAVDLILSAFRMADHPGDTASVCHLLNSPLAEPLGLNDGTEKDANLAALAIRRRLGDDGSAVLVGHWARHLSTHCDERGARRLQQLVTLAETYDREPGVRPLDFVRFVDSQEAEEPSSGGVQVMTLHKSKGLEFEIVVLPELHRGLPGRPPALLFGRDEQTHEIDRVTAWPKSEVAEIDSTLRALRDEHYERDIREALCLLYVGLTRAKRALHILIPPQPNYKNGNPKFNMAAWLSHALAVPEPQQIPTGARRLYELGYPQWWLEDPPAAPSPQAALRPAAHLDPSLLATWPGRVRTRKRPSEKIADEGSESFVLPPQTEETDIPERKQDFLSVDARRRGLALHAVMELFEWAESGFPPEEKLIAQARLAVPSLTREEAQALVARAQTALQLPEIAKILSRASYPDYVELHRECDFAAYLNEDFAEYAAGRLDRLVLQRQSGRPSRAWIQDFKSDAVANPTRYAAQMRTYRQSLAKSLNLEESAITLTLLFLESGRVITL